MKLLYYYSKFVRRVLLGKSLKDCQIDKTASVDSGCNILNTSIGRYSYIGYDSWIVYADIGGFCSIADDVYIGGCEHPLDWVSTSPVFENVKNTGVQSRFAYFHLPAHKRTRIGNDVWIGHAAIIKAGVFVGDGAVVGAGAIVTKDVPPYAIVGGVPSKVLKYRFDEETISHLLESQWWNLPDDILSELGQYIKDPKEFLERLGKVKTRVDN